MPLLKLGLDMHLFQRLLGIIAFIFITLYSMTFKIKIHLKDTSINYDDFFTKHPTRPKSGNNYLYAFWHQDELSLLSLFAYKKIGILVSNSKDGTIMATVLRLLGYQIVRGSSHRNGVSGFLKAFKMVLQGHYFALAVDGPKGPIFKVKEGIIQLSQKGNRPIIPLRIYPEKYFEFTKAWNKAKLPKPFTTVHLVVGLPDFYNQESLEVALNELKY